MYQKVKAEKLRAEKERALYANLKNGKGRGGQLDSPEVLRKPQDIRDDPRYEGQTQFMIDWVPMKCRDEKTPVDEISLREWILFAVVEEDPASKVYYDDIAKINKLIDGIDFNLLKIPKLEFLDQDGKPYPIEKARAEREALYNLLSAQRTTAEEDLELAERNLKNHNDWRRSMGVELIKGEEDKNTDTCTWFVRLYGTDDAKELEDLLIEKEDWPGIKLACGVKNHDPPIPPWTGRSTSPPDGSKVQDITDYTLLQVNIGGARIARIPAGCYRGYFVNNIKHGKGSLEYGYSKDRVLGKKKKAEQSASPKKDPTTSKEAPGDGKSDKKNGSPAKSNASPKTKKNDTPLPTASSMQAAAEEEALARDLSEFNMIYQGYFFGGNISNKGCTMNTRIQMPGIISRLDPRATYGITKVLKREERQQKSANHSVERFNDIEGHIRDEIQRKKIKIFNQQKHFTKKTMYAADVYGLSQGAIHEFESKLHLRKERLNNLTEDNHLYKKALVPRLRIPNNASNEFLRKAFERIKPDANEVDPAEQVDENVLKILLSDFEEVQERQRFLKYDRIWQRAEDAYVGNRSAAV
eukprot:gene22867-25899_t